MNHGPAFQALWSRLRAEVRQLQDRGYYGDGRNLFYLVCNSNTDKFHDARLLVLWHEASRLSPDRWPRYRRRGLPRIYGLHLFICAFKFVIAQVLYSAVAHNLGRDQRPDAAAVRKGSAGKLSHHCTPGLRQRRNGRLVPELHRSMPLLVKVQHSPKTAIKALVSESKPQGRSRYSLP
jgi:hypothetical protein